MFVCNCFQDPSKSSVSDPFEISFAGQHVMGRVRSEDSIHAQQGRQLRPTRSAARGVARSGSVSVLVLVLWHHYDNMCA